MCCFIPRLRVPSWIFILFFTHAPSARLSAATSTANTSAFRILRGTPAVRPIFLVKTDYGRVLTRPDQVDDEVCSAWQKVYDGTGGDSDARIASFVREYRHHMHVEDEMVLPSITGTDVQHACTIAKPTAAGFDAWKPADLKNLPAKAYGWLAELLNLIERGAAWPDALMWGRAVYSAKDPTETTRTYLFNDSVLAKVHFRKCCFQFTFWHKNP